MSYPVITDHFRAQLTLNNGSGLPTDVYVNNWYFRNDGAALVVQGDYDALQAQIQSVLEAFWTQVNGTATQALSYFLGGDVVDATLKVYDLGETPPRYPVSPETTLAITSSAVGDPLPEEVACCLSYKAGQGPRRKGRLYIGPLRSVAVDIGANHVRPSAAFQQTLGESGLNVLNTSENVTWVQVSPSDAVATPVEELWVDDAFDTQRSRGAEPTARRRWDTNGEIV